MQHQAFLQYIYRYIADYITVAMAKSEPRLKGRLELETDLGAFLGGTRIKLLEGIAQHGSITQAAKSVPLSYKAAWDAVDAMNNLADQPLVTRVTGGKHGGGTNLTEYGQRVVALYRALETESQGALDRLAQGMHKGEAVSFEQFRNLLRRFSLRSSARNQFAGTVAGLVMGEIDCEVRIKLDDVNQIVAVITRESAETLELALGKEVYALIKSSSVLLLTDSAVHTSARNQLWGVVERVHGGPVNSEVVLSLGAGKSVCAVVTCDSANRLKLASGERACALFKASSVIVCL